MSKAIRLTEDDQGKIHHHFDDISASDLPSPEGKQQDVVVKIHHSTLNYKDAMVVNGIGRLVKSYPHIPGIDFAGEVLESHHKDYKAGDKVLLTGWRVGEFFNGGLSGLARIDGDWLVPLPDGLSMAQAMSIGTAGFTAMLAIYLLEQQGLSTNANLPVLVTGASGGVGSIAVSLLSHYGYDVAAVTGKPQAAEFLTKLGATQIVNRDELNVASKRPLEKENWAAAIDAVGGVMLARVLAQIAYGGSVAAVGLAGGSSLSGTVLPFLLRGVRLIGIDSVICPRETRNICWQRLASDLPKSTLEAVTTHIHLEQVPEYTKSILEGGVQGRIVVDMDLS
ncbi:MAG: MDR family oxidoreductase [Alphaproteobacteria bacterium]